MTPAKAEKVIKYFEDKGRHVVGVTIREDSIAVQFHLGHRPSTSRSIPEDLRLAVLKRDKSACRYCGCHCDSPHLDHVVPWSRGGQHTMQNLVVACPACNLAKSNKTPAEWKNADPDAAPIYS